MILKNGIKIKSKTEIFEIEANDESNIREVEKKREKIQ